MKGFPQYFATKEDYKNIMRDFPKWRGRVMKELKSIQKIKDDEVTRAIRLVDPNDPDSGWITEKIPNPFPIHRQKGFKNKKELHNLIHAANVAEEEKEKK